VLEVDNLHTTIGEHAVLSGINLSIRPGETHAIMGPNGSGKSSLALTIAGHPHYMVTRGTIKLENKSITKTPAFKRAKAGLMVSFQNPVAVPGVIVGSFMREAYKSVKGKTPSSEFRTNLYDALEQVGLGKEFAGRSINDGFSGGERKRLEIAQMLILQPKLAILDEIDSGLDIDAIKTIATILKQYQSPKRAQILITHYSRIFQHIEPNVVHIMVNGTIVQSGDISLAHHVEKHGYTNGAQKA